MFGNAAREHMKRYGTTKEQLAKIALKNHKHSTNNPYENHHSLFRKHHYILNLGVKIRNLKVDFKTGGTWQWVRLFLFDLVV